MSRTLPNSRPSIIPPLENGDRLTREEFERRFDATPGLKRAELLNGIVYMPPPISHSYHSKPHTQLSGLMFIYSASTPGVEQGDAGSIRLDAGNMPQPDLYLMITGSGGQAQVDSEGYVRGAPELMAEVAASSASYDLHIKMDVYRRSGVREYIVWRTYEREIDYFILREGTYVRLTADERGICRSECFPGLWIDRASLLSGDLAAAVKALQEGLQTPEHETFAASLRS